MSYIKPTRTFEHPAVAFSWEGSKYLRHKIPTTIYLDSNDLDRLHVKCTNIDINSGTPEDEGLQVLQLKSPKEINAIVEADELIKAGAIPSIEYSPGNWHTAYSLGLFYLNLFNQQGKSTVNAPDPSSKTLLERISSWEINQKSTDERVDPSKIYWRATFTLHIRDNSLPDVICFLANEAPLEDDKLFLSELRCILRMGGAKLRQETRNQEIAPVTVVSASGIHVRIVQGYVDGGKNCLFVRKSDIIKVDGIEKQSVEGLMSIACWLLGKPCRKTRVVKLVS
ncbi:hypothetical protein GGR53DRAFT_412770 [Hypoxylon sp. FL1150]|nr:hypothetical protein GGR53DRAFT_412770 [Hypoxylon sp. FL1150]